LIVGLLSLPAPLPAPTRARPVPVPERTFARIAVLARSLSTPTITDGPDLQVPVGPGPVSTETPPIWAWPLRGPITQFFGQRLTRYGFHEGLDIDGRTGDPVRAAAAGTVLMAGRDLCGGLAVGLDHGNGLSSWYGHLSRIAVRVGQQIDVEAVIGRVGNTGCSLGSHLHFAIRVGDTFVDPLPYLPQR